MDSTLFKYALLAFITCFASGCVAMLVVAGTIHWNIFFYAFFPDYVSVPSILLLTTSCLLICVATLGVYGVLRDKSWMLRVFAVLVAVLLVIQLAGGVIALSMEATLNEPLENNMIVAQENYNTSASDREIWNDVQREYRCCGVNSYTEWEDFSFLTAPQSCKCTVRTEQCVDYKDQKIYSLGCYPRLRDYVHNLEVILGALAISFIAFQMFCIASAFLIGKANEPPRSADC